MRYFPLEAYQGRCHRKIRNQSCGRFCICFLRGDPVVCCQCPEYGEVKSGCGETYHCSHDEVLRGVNQTERVSVGMRRGCSGRGGYVVRSG